MSLDSWGTFKAGGPAIAGAAGVGFGAAGVGAAGFGAAGVGATGVGAAGVGIGAAIGAGASCLGSSTFGASTTGCSATCAGGAGFLTGSFLLPHPVSNTPSPRMLTNTINHFILVIVLYLFEMLRMLRIESKPLAR